MLESCETAKTCSASSQCQAGTTCCEAGSCENKKCLPDLSKCVEVTTIFQAVGTNQNCLLLFSGLVSANSFENYCSALLDGLKCASGELMKVAGAYSDMCFERMKGYIRRHPDAIANAVKQYLGGIITINQDFLSNSSQCIVPAEDDSREKDDETDGEKDDEGDDEDWNSSCPKLEESLCLTECTENSNCTGENMACCNTGGDECFKCMPDLKQCGDVGQILIAQTAKGNCLQNLTMIAQVTTFKEYCRAALGAFECLAEKVMPSQKALCRKRMALSVQRSPNVIMEAIKLMSQQQGQGQGQSQGQGQGFARLIKFVKDTAECEDFHKAPPPLVPDDVKECSDIRRIANAAGQCRRITDSSVTNESCGNLKTLIECIAKKLVSGGDENKIKKCVGEISEFVEDNRGELPQVFGNLDPDACEERKSVCGGDLKPLDGVNCRSSRCPAKHTCKAGFCCPEVKKGVCPKPDPGVRLLCKQKCRVDSDCDDDEKCCNSAGCGRTCLTLETETEDKSECEKEFENGKRQLEKDGICGDGKTLTKLPQCQNKGYSPAQYMLGTNGGYCVNENGEKINGSYHTGNRDCTKVRDGVCPQVPSQCTTVGKNADTCQSDDFRCGEGQKCCITYEDNTCLKRCVTARAAPETELDECTDRKCCPITLCHGKVCMSDVTARCRINSCGGCKAEFYNLKGKVDCDEGVPLCPRKRAAAIEENSRKLTSDLERIASFMDARERTQREKEEEKDESDMYGEEDDGDDDDDDGDDTNGNGAGDDEDDADDADDDEEKKQDEYGIPRERESDLPEDGNEMTGMEDMQKMSAVHRRLCDLFDTLQICENGGQCKIGSGESFYEFCKCNTGYSGIFCENEESVTPDTQCNRDRQRLMSMDRFIHSQDHMKEKMILKTVFSVIKPPQNIVAMPRCQPSGGYEEIQMGMIVPQTMNTLLIVYCADTTTGERKKGTPVTMPGSGKMPNCSVTSALPDILSLPKRCMSQKMSECTGTDKCQYFWNQATGMCEKGKAGKGFLRLTDCYHQCGIYRGCTNAPSDSTDEYVCEKGVISGPKPCRIPVENSVEVDLCDYDRQFCDVEETTTGQNGTCKDFPRHCLEEPDSGYGDKSIGSYYFNAKVGKCMKMTYKGSGGNGNRFYSILHCHTECSTRPYKEGVCPVPEILGMSMPDQQNLCDEDNDCYGMKKCCLSGKSRVCTGPVRTCFTSVRCSLFGACADGRCTCNTCDDTPKFEVCGSDSKTYDSVCHLEKRACETMQDITVAYNGTCKFDCGNDLCIEVEQQVCGTSAKSGAMCTFGNTCKMTRSSCQMKEVFVKVKDGPCNPGEFSGTCTLPCTKEYNPVCVYDTEISKHEVYSNPCRVKEAIMSGKKIQILSPGVCFQECGQSQTKCDYYEECMNNTCTCNGACTKEYRPVCAHPYNDNNNLITFPNLCLLKLQSCKEQKMHYIVKHGPCKKPEAVLDCPATRPDIPYSAVVECKTDDDAYCNTEKGEKCCPYGAGNVCLPRTALVRRNVVKNGICPTFSNMDYDESLCKESKCMADDDCEGDTQCCDNNVCGHMTCVAPKVRQTDSPCGANAKMVSDCSPGMTETGCPKEGTCNTTVLPDNDPVGVCCIPVEQIEKGGTEEKLARAKFCSLMEMTNNECSNGGTCVGDIRNGKVCQCKEGYFGPLCRGTRPPVPCNLAQVQCIANPCDVYTCPGVPDATCEANYCGGCYAIFKKDFEDVSHLCHASRCLVQKGVLSALGESIYTDESPMENSDDMASRRRRRDTHMEGDMEMMYDINPLKKKLMYLMKKMGMPTARLNLEQLCAPGGEFNLEQCVSGKNGSQQCFCVDGQTGIPIPHGPKVSNLQSLNCSDLSPNNIGLQKFCVSERPRKSICGGSMTKRYFYNPATMDCERFSDFGCNVDISNNFASYETCKSACGVRDTRLSKCAVVRCGFGQQCIVDNGNAMCDDPDNFKPKFEPVCDDSGLFNPKQCSGDVCTCVNPETGNAFANSVAEGTNLKCPRGTDGNVTAVIVQAKNCSGSQPAVFCENGGDVCNNCAKEESQEDTDGNDRKVDDNNVCTSCQSCPAGQGRQKCDTEKLCKNKCKEFYNAVCQINRCTCTEEYFADGQKVNCTVLNSQCLKERQAAKLAEMSQSFRNNGQRPNNVKQVNCTNTGAYYSVCDGEQCQCLNATDGRRMGAPQSKNSIDCSSEHDKTLALQMDVEITFTGNWNKMNSRKQEKFAENSRRKMEKEFPLKVVRENFRQGSIIGSFVVEDCGSDCEVSVGTSDLASTVNALLMEVETNGFPVEAEGEIFVSESAVIADVITREELEGPVITEKPPEDDDNKTTIIIVVVIVVVVVVLVAVGIACYCYSKANKTKTKDIPFTDIQGKSNPAYDKP